MENGKVVDYQSKTVWKVASRWSEDGNSGSSILQLFRRHNVVFVGTKQHLFRQIEEGSLVAVSDGKKVVALGVVHSPVTPLTDLNLTFTQEELGPVEPNESILAVRLSFMDLDASDYVDYRIGAVHRVKERAEQFRKLYAKYNQHYKEEQAFEISAKSCTLLNNSSKPDEVLWQDDHHFHVPVYQRPYSWGEKEIRRLLTDLLTAFWGRLGRAPREPMFVGTMQLSAPFKLDETSAVVQEVIDGQQRSTTLILTLKALQLLIPDSSVWSSIQYRKRLKTLVNGGIQQNYFMEALNEDCSNVSSKELNPYLRALHFILDELKQEDEWCDSEGLIEEFVHYLTSKVYFVVIETRASLSKTLQIFDAINTSGMDLNGGDVFKVRFYEYLKEIHKYDDSIFEEICGLYEHIDAENRKLGRKAVKMSQVLNLAQQIVITESGMPKGPRSLAGTTFFDRFFDTVLNINRWDGFRKDACDKVVLTIEKLRQLTDLLFSWQGRPTDLLSSEAEAMARFIHWSRYGSYYQVIHMFRYRFNPSNEELESFIINFSKLLFIYSVRFQKVTKDGHNCVYDIMKRLCSDEHKLSLAELNDYLVKRRNEQLRHLEYALDTHSIAHIPRAKNLLCRLSAMLDELEHSQLDSKALRSLLFETSIDIEHIESANHEDLEQREVIHKEWGSELHRLGNLIVLEYKINRSISNKNYVAVKRARYKDSQFVSVKRFSDQNESWSLEQCRARKKEQVEKLANYLCI